MPAEWLLSRGRGPRPFRPDSLLEMRAAASGRGRWDGVLSGPRSGGLRRAGAHHFEQAESRLLIWQQGRRQNYHEAGPTVSPLRLRLRQRKARRAVRADPDVVAYAPALARKSRGPGQLTNDAQPCRGRRRIEPRIRRGMGEAANLLPDALLTASPVVAVDSSKRRISAVLQGARGHDVRFGSKRLLLLDRTVDPLSRRAANAENS
jgi:hypothetical protein